MPLPFPVPSPPVLLEIVPPVHVAAVVHVPPLPVTVKPPVSCTVQSDAVRRAAAVRSDAAEGEAAGPNGGAGDIERRCGGRVSVLTMVVLSWVA